MLNLKEKHSQEIQPKLATELGRNLHDTPFLSKVVVSVGVGPFKDNKEIVESVKSELTDIVGQVPKTTTAKKSISGFKVREGEVIGLVETLRGKRMWDFVDRLIGVVMPRIRDFSGVKVKSIDKNGNLNISISEHTVFPEIKPDETKTNWGMTITFTLRKNENVEVAKDYYKLLGIVFMED